MLKNLETDLDEAKQNVNARKEAEADLMGELEKDIREVRGGRMQSRSRAAGPDGQANQAWQAGGPMQMTSRRLQDASLVWALPLCSATCTIT